MIFGTIKPKNALAVKYVARGVEFMGPRPELVMFCPGQDPFFVLNFLYHHHRVPPGNRPLTNSDIAWKFGQGTPALGHADVDFIITESNSKRMPDISMEIYPEIKSGALMLKNPSTHLLKVANGSSEGGDLVLGQGETVHLWKESTTVRLFTRSPRTYLEFEIKLWCSSKEHYVMERDDFFRRIRPNYHPMPGLNPLPSPTHQEVSDIIVHGLPVREASGNHVYSAIHKMTGEPLVIKRLEILEGDDVGRRIDSIRNEVQMSRATRNGFTAYIDNIWYSHGVSVEPQLAPATCFLVMGKADSNMRYFLATKREIGIGYRLQLLNAVLITMYELHQVGVFHRNISLKSVLILCKRDLNDELMYHPILGDFSRATKLEKDTEENLGPAHTVAPEVGRGEYACAPVDIWDFTVLCISVLEGCVPEGNNDVGAVGILKPLDRLNALYASSVIGLDLYNILRKGIAENPEERISAREMWQSDVWSARNAG
ncbi:kinase-like domain-containing protein [Annulohypoxylon maeteangense]|uniref:kinase-like domain-containing protein n=1 Tax=Annulohypoxylon maeteangense TaxID=1927788 RepID=UPI002008DBAD|nr:kinase-like domain-containing protein [Annulohypoxylon maeteangense]KAI0885051.1 kinase-like domain-containing protein [Annulohypoxylon maeteangense]